MESLYQYLVRREDGLLLLLTPPFDRTIHDPGYIKGYLPGTRENGGQYTHAAIWALWAFAELRQKDRVAELFKLINPIQHSDTPEKIIRYRVEPYVVAADVYNAAHHTGRGGWTWYTGSASWMYRLAVEKILGLQREGNHLKINPCIPANWQNVEIRYRFGTSLYHICIENMHSTTDSGIKLTVDDTLINTESILLTDDGSEHNIHAALY